MSTWQNDLVKGKIIPALRGYCNGLQTHFGILSNGKVVACCGDYDGRCSIGDLKKDTLISILSKKANLKLRDDLLRGKLTKPYCRRCRGGSNIVSWFLRQIGSSIGYRYKFFSLRP